MLRRMTVKSPRTFTPNKEDVLYLQDKAVFIVNGGIKRDLKPYELEDRFLYDAYNMYYSPKDSEIKTRPGYSLFGMTTPLAGHPIMNITQFFKYTPAGSSYLCAFTTKCCYVYNTSTKVWDNVSPHLDVCDCEDAWTASANVTSTADTSVKRYGSKSAKHVIAAAFTTGSASYRDLAAPLDLHIYTHLYFYIRSSVALAAGDLQIKLWDAPTVTTLLETLSVPAIPLVDTWYEFCIAFADASALTSVACISLNVVTDVGANTVYLDNISAVTCFTGDADDKFVTEQIYDDNDGEVKFIVTNYVDNVRFWNGTGNWADLGGTPNKAKDMINFNHYLVLSNVVVTGTNVPQRLDWPVIGSPEDWSGSGSGNVALAGSMEENKKLMILRGYLIILKGDSITAGSFIGGVDPFTFNESEITGVGCGAGGSAQDLDGKKLAFLGNDNAYTYDGYSPILISGNVSNFLMSNINANKLTTVHSYNLVDKKLWIFCVPSASSDYPDIAWVYCYAEGNEGWYRWAFKDKIMCFGAYLNFDAKTIGEMLDKIGTYSLKLSYIGSESLVASTLIGDSAGYIYELGHESTNDNGTKIRSYIDTKSYMFNTIGNYASLEYVAAIAKGSTLDISVSTDNGKTFTKYGTLTLGSDEQELYLNNIRASAEKHMVRFENNVLDEWFSLSGFRCGVIIKERYLG